MKALETKNKAEDITRVLYPNDSTLEGKQLRIKQQYVLSSASLQDILRSFRENHGCDYYRLPQMSASTRSSLALAVERSSTFTPKVRSFVRTMPLLLLAIWFSSISTYSHRTLL